MTKPKPLGQIAYEASTHDITLPVLWKYLLAGRKAHYQHIADCIAREVKRRGRKAK